METELKQKLKRIVESLEKSEFPFYEACKELKALIEPEKWEPEKIDGRCYQIMGDGHFCKDESADEYRLYGNEWPTKEHAELARDMNKRNQWILQAKIARGFGDGEWIISYDGCDREWKSVPSRLSDNPENTFETKAQGQEVIKMVGLND